MTGFGHDSVHIFLNIIHHSITRQHIPKFPIDFFASLIIHLLASLIKVALVGIRLLSITIVLQYRALS